MKELAHRFWGITRVWEAALLSNPARVTEQTLKRQGVMRESRCPIFDVVAQQQTEKYESKVQGNHAGEHKRKLLEAQVYDY